MRGEILLGVIDTRWPGSLGRLDREVAGWHGFARVEWLDRHRACLLARGGGALTLPHRELPFSDKRWATA
jgi:hypothetical protein